MTPPGKRPTQLTHLPETKQAKTKQHKLYSKLLCNLQGIYFEKDFI